MLAPAQDLLFQCLEAMKPPGTTGFLTASGRSLVLLVSHLPSQFCCPSYLKPELHGPAAGLFLCPSRRRSSRACGWLLEKWVLPSLMAPPFPLQTVLFCPTWLC